MKKSVMRIITYDGDSEWVDFILSKSLPVGRRELGGKDRFIEVRQVNLEASITPGEVKRCVKTLRKFLPTSSIRTPQHADTDTKKIEEECVLEMLTSFLRTRAHCDSRFRPTADFKCLLVKYFEENRGLYSSLAISHRIEKIWEEWQSPSPER